MRFLITGLSGFVGRHLAALLLARGDEVWSWHYREDLAAKISQRPDIFRKVR